MQKSSALRIDYSLPVVGKQLVNPAPVAWLNIFSNDHDDVPAGKFVFVFSETLPDHSFQPVSVAGQAHTLATDDQSKAGHFELVIPEQGDKAPFGDAFV